MTKDMTSGSPAKLIFGFAIPMFLGLLFQQFYSMVDTLIVGKFLGVNPLAGVGSTTSFELYGAGILYGCLQWVCNSRGSDVRSKRRTQTSTVCDEWRMALHRIFNSDDTGGRCSLPAGSCINADTRRNI